LWIDVLYINNNPNLSYQKWGRHFGMNAPSALYWFRKLDSATKKALPMKQKPIEARCLARNHKD